MNSVSRLVLAIMVTVLPAVSIGCTHSSITELFLVPFAHSAVNAGVDGAQTLVDEQIDARAGDSPVARAFGHGLGVAFGDLMETVATRVFGETIVGD